MDRQVFWKADFLRLLKENSFWIYKFSFEVHLEITFLTYLVFLVFMMDKI